MECFQKLSSFEDVNKLKVKELKAILERYGQSVSGKKNDLVLRCCAILDKTNNEGKVLKDQENVNNVKANGGDVTVEKILERTVDGEWTKDLRTLPEFHFVELYDYLVRRTMKYDHESIRTLGYKKLKAFQFFKEGHLKDLQVCSVGSLSYLKAEILASMKQIKYLAVVVFNHHGNVVKAACKCPAGRGVDGCGHCNHVGSVLFAVEDFCRRGLKEHNEVVSCTSRICQWNVPRNIKVQPKPVDDILFTRYRFGKESSSIPKSSLYDPRAPSDRTVNNEALETLCESMSSSVGSSSFFLFHKVKSTYNQSSNVEIESYCEALPEVTEVLPQELEEPDLPFNDDYDIKSSSFKSMVDSYRETITETEIKQIERMTRGQSSNKAWQELKQNKLTASNFHAASTRKAEPDKLLKSIMYSFNTDENPIASLKYGQLHEKDAVHCYIKAEIASGNTGIKVWEVGTIISKERPGFGASLDRKVFDPTARGSKIGGLEVKCPISKQGQTPEEACGDPSFYMIMKDGMPKLKEGHRYYYQVQGQMYVCELEWVDFVVWLGGDSIIKERLSFDRKWWINEALPRLDYFYKHAFLPEVFTRRVKRGIRLYRHNGWQSYKQHMKYGRSS